MIKLDVRVVQEYYKLKEELGAAYEAYDGCELNSEKLAVLEASYQMALDKFKSYCIYAIAKMVSDEEVAEVYKDNY
jgi:hypothetical protein